MQQQQTPNPKQQNSQTAKPPNRQTAKPPNRQTAKPPKRPNGQAAKRPNGQTAKRPNGQTAKRPNGQTAKRPNGQMAKRPIGQTAKRPNGLTPFLTQSREAMARNIVALTRSKGLCVLLLPSTQEFRFSFLHILRTLCAYRHGLYHIGNAPPDPDRLATFLSLPDATFNPEPCIFNQGSWLLTHQISYFGAWDFLPLAMQLSHEEQTYILTLCLRSDLPQPDHWEVSAGHFSWQEFRAGHPYLSCFWFSAMATSISPLTAIIWFLCSPSAKQYSCSPNG